jgi:RNA polymerase sigma factor (sigma-70 family)
MIGQTDEQLMDEYCAGDLAAFAALFDRYRHRLARFAVRFVGADGANDVVQQVFLRVHQQRHRFSSGTCVAAWLFTIARNTAIDVTRSAHHKRTRSSVSIDDAVGLAAAEVDVVDGTIAGKVRDAIALLPAAQRDVISLHYLAELPFPEVAELLRIKPDAARARAARAYETLRTNLGSMVEVRHE